MAKQETGRTIIRKGGLKYTPKENKDRFFFPEEYIKFQQNLKRKNKHSAIVQINTGARIKELQNVKVEDCYLQDRRIVLKVTKRKAKKKEARGRERIIPISSEFSKYLKKFFDKNKLKPSDYILISKTCTFNIAIKRAAKKAGIEGYNDFSSHNLRKTLEVWLMSLDVQTLSLLAHFGHDIKTAAVNYVSPDIFSWEDRQKMRKIIGDLYDRRRG